MGPGRLYSGRTKLPTVYRGLMEIGVDPLLAAGWIREYANMSTSFSLGGKELSRPVRRRNTVPQGDTGAPKIFNAALDVPASLFIEECKRNHYGLYFTDGCGGPLHYCFILYADNFWLIGKSPGELQAMFRMWIELLAIFGWTVPADECTWATTMKDDARAAVSDESGKIIRRARRSEGFKALGCQITFDSR